MIASASGLSSPVSTRARREGFFGSFRLNSNERALSLYFLTSVAKSACAARSTPSAARSGSHELF